MQRDLGLVFAGLAVGYVVVASLFGLANPMAFLGPEVVYRVWAASWEADMVFVAGMVTVGWVAFELAWRISRIASVVVAGFGTWCVYALSWWTLGLAKGAPLWGKRIEDLGQAFAFTGRWGWAGIAVCAFAPMLAASWLRRQISAAPPSPAAVGRPGL